METRHTRIMILTALCVLGIQTIIGLAIIWIIPDWTKRGQFGDLFGDLFGVVNALFSGLAFAGLIYAILLQREDLALQRTELELTRKELARSAVAQEQSESALSTQAKSASTSARLSATSFLLELYQNERKLYDPRTFKKGDSVYDKVTELDRRINILNQVLDDVFKEIAEKR